MKYALVALGIALVAAVAIAAFLLLVRWLTTD